MFSRKKIKDYNELKTTNKLNNLQRLIIDNYENIIKRYVRREITKKDYDNFIRIATHHFKELKDAGLLSNEFNRLGFRPCFWF